MNSTERLVLKTYQQVWTHKTRDGWQYEYICTWSDGSVTREFTLPWDRMADAIELPATSERELRAVTLEEATDIFCAAIAAPYRQAAE